MWSRLAGRLVTGPVAFLVAGVADMVALTIAFLRWRWGQRVGSTRRSVGEERE